MTEPPPTDGPVHVLLTLRFSDEQLNRLRSISPRLVIRQQSIRDDREDVSAFLTGQEEIVYCMTPPREIRLAPQLNWVQLHSAGVDSLRDHPIWKTAVQVTTSSGIHAVPIGEYAITLMLALARKLPKVFRFQERAEWPKHKWQVFLGSELRGKTVGVIGYGSIGGEVARIAKFGFNMDIVAMRYGEGSGRLRYHEPGVGDPDRAYPKEWFSRGELHSMLGASDFVLLSMPLTKDTKHLIGESELHAMKRDAFLINIARGELVDERALVRALKENWIAGAGLDAYAVEPLPRESQLWRCENAILAPHVSSATPNYDNRAVALFSENLRRYLSRTPLLNLVDKERGY